MGLREPSDKMDSATAHFTPAVSSIGAGSLVVKPRLISHRKTFPLRCKVKNSLLYAQFATTSSRFQQCAVFRPSLFAPDEVSHFLRHHVVPKKASHASHRRSSRLKHCPLDFVSATSNCVLIRAADGSDSRKVPDEHDFENVRISTKRHRSTTFEQGCRWNGVFSRNSTFFHIESLGRTFALSCRWTMLGNTVFRVKDFPYHFG